MEHKKELFLIMKSDEDKIKIILKNVLIMLGNRIYIDENNVKHKLLDANEALENVNAIGDNVFTITANNNEKYAIKIIFQKIASIGKQSVIHEFFKEYAKYKKIIVAQDFQNKISNFMLKSDTQIFKESSMLTDIISHCFQPKYELLTPIEQEQIKLEYNITDYTAQKILINDPVVKYYNLKKGNYIRIIRPSTTAGYGINYRVVA